MSYQLLSLSLRVLWKEALVCWILTFQKPNLRRKKLICILENILCQCKPDLVSKEFLIRLELSSTGNAMERHQWLVGPPPGLLSQKTNTNTQKTNTQIQLSSPKIAISGLWGRLRVWRGERGTFIVTISLFFKINFVLKF